MHTAAHPGPQDRLSEERAGHIPASSAYSPSVPTSCKTAVWVRDDSEGSNEQEKKGQVRNQNNRHRERRAGGSGHRKTKRWFGNCSDDEVSAGAYEGDRSHC